MSMDTVSSGHGQSANKTANENVGTDIESDFTVSSSQKVKAETALRKIWLGSKYKRCRTLSDLSNGYLYALIW
jgi:hypothetical protein